MKLSPDKIAARFSKPSNYLSLQSRVTRLNRSLYKEDLCLSHLVKLEKAVIRGEAFDREVKFTPRVFNSTSMNSPKSLNRDSETGLSIVKLPKLPFGSHNPYNGRGAFKKHFLSVEDKEKDTVKKMNGALKIPEKKTFGSSLMHTKRKIFGQFSGMDIYDSRNGKLVCERQEEVNRAYDMVKQNFLNREGEEKLKEYKKKHEKKPEEIARIRKAQRLSVQRLTNSPRFELESVSSKAFISKYPSLFE